MQSLGWLKKFGPAQNILGPVKGQGITILQHHNWSRVIFVTHLKIAFWVKPASLAREPTSQVIFSTHFLSTGLRAALR